MSNQWRTVYKSSHKHVMIKPRNHPQPRSRQSNPIPSEKSPDPLGFVGGAVLLIAGVAVAVECWPYIVALLILYAIGRSRRK